MERTQADYLCGQNKEDELHHLKENAPPLNGKIEKKKQNLFQTKNDISPKAIAEAQRQIVLVQERGMGILAILKHDLLTTCPLFEVDFPAEATKSKLMAEIALIASKWDQLLITYSCICRFHVQDPPYAS